MRTALLSAIRRDETGQIRALLPLAGRSVLGWQADFVLDNQELFFILKLEARL